MASVTRQERRRLKREKKRRQAIRRWTSYRYARLAYGALRLLPLGLAVRFGAVVGWLFGHVPGWSRQDALHHLEIALGDETTPRDRRRIVSDLFVHLGRSVFEFLVYTRLGPEAVAASVEEVRGEEHLREAYARGRGVVAVTPHFGLWEVLPVFTLARGYRACAVGVKMHFDPADRFVSSMRERLGVETIHQSRARELLRRLRSGEIVGILPDQDANHLAGIFLPFFGREAYTLTGPATLASTARCPIVPVAIRRTGPHRHRMDVYPAIEMPAEGSREERVREGTIAVSRAMEEIIRSDPSQWVWFHQRWRTTPENLEKRRVRRARKQARLMRRRSRNESPGGNAVSAR